MEHPDLAEVCVLGVPDDVYGERVGLVCRTKTETDLDDESERTGGVVLGELQNWCRGRMAQYMVPTRLVVLTEDIPKNAMGKVNKKQLVCLFETES